jgi:two-component system sensor kinase FixL
MKNNVASLEKKPTAILSKRESENLYRGQYDDLYSMFIDSVRDYAIFITDADGRILTWNRGAERVKGYKASEILGKSVDVCYSQDEIERGLPEKERTIAVRLGRFESEGWQVKKDGSKFYASMVLTALKDENGELRGFGKVVRDLTVQKKQEERFQKIVESLPNGIIMVDRSGNISLCNSDIERMFEYKREDIIGKPIEFLVPERDKEPHRRFRNVYMKNPRKLFMGTTRNLYGQRRDGSEFPVEVGLSPVQTMEGDFILASVVDITERKTIEEELRRAYEALRSKSDEMEQFVYTVSHDLKAPLVTSSSFTTFLREDLAANKIDAVMDSLDRIERAHARMKALIDDLLELSRIGRLRLNLEEVDLNHLIRESLDGLAVKIERSGISVELSADFPVVTVDKNRLQQAFDNLIINALKYGSGNCNPVLKIFWRRTNGEVQICFKDNGIGVDPKYHKRIFKLFQRLDTDDEGTGVGLAIVSRVAQLHGGRAWLVSEAGKGAEFWMAVPDNLMSRR